MDEKLINSFLELLIEKNGSDMFLTYNEVPSIRINMQIHRMEDTQKLNDKILNRLSSELVNNETTRAKFQKELNIDLSVEHH